MNKEDVTSAHPNPENIMQVGLGFWGSKTLLTAVELGLFTELARGPKSADEIKGTFKLHSRSVKDFLDALVAMNFLQRSDDKYANSPDVDIFLDRAKPSYVGGILEMANTRLFKFWGSLTEALRTGKPQNEAKEGKNIFEIIYSHPDKLREFLKAMTGISMGAAMAIAQKFPWSKYKTFIDIGAAQGGLCVQVALANKHLTGGGFDLSAVGPIFEEYVTANKLQDRLKFYSGDFFKDPLPQAEVLVMGHVLHDWNKEEKLQLLEKAYKALPEKGALIVFEAIIDDDRSKNVFGLLMSLNMLLETPGGFDYTGKDCSDWMKKVGFRETRVEHLVGPDSMVIGIK